ncbi:hypothetical protein CC2G_004924 [Coprinopsis cinerea AmutBmut pab1-1]|nr:hypothetical protein CC2G_004924 [Coprinopsis cinerea AmutBmut pab1-1]
MKTHHLNLTPEERNYFGLNNISHERDGQFARPVPPPLQLDEDGQKSKVAIYPPTGINSPPRPPAFSTAVKDPTGPFGLQGNSKHFSEMT